MLSKRFRVSFMINKNVVKIIVVMDTHSVNILKATESYTLSGSVV